MVTMYLAILAFFTVWGTALGQGCPASKEPMEAKTLCEKHKMKMATVKDLATFSYLGRQLEEWVHATSSKDTWYWLDAKFNLGKEVYVWGDNPNDPLKFTNFFYRYPRPTGVGSQVDWQDIYQKNSTVEQCLAFALPLPRVENSKKGAVLYGYSTTFDEKPCEGRKKRHAICESTVPECNSETADPFYLTEDKNQYFNDGHWIIGERKYIVSWKQRNRKESEDYCKKLGLQMYNPSIPASKDSSLVPHLKLWSRNITMSQFWTSWTYKVENGNGMFTNSDGVMVTEQKAFIQYSSLTGRSNKDSMQFCVASQLYYEFREQLHCSKTDNACTWSGMERVPTNCNNYMGTICQHKDHEKRLVEWNTGYINSPDLLINNGTKATIEFGWEGNSFTRRSRFKQTFGSLLCPTGYKMLRQKFSDSLYTPPRNTTIFSYDFLDSYWVVDDEGFKKDATSKCAVSVPTSEDGSKRKVETVECSEWHFYLCRLVTVPLHVPDEKLPYSIPKSPGWNAARHSRVYPIV